MRAWLKDLDDLLRGNKTDLRSLQRGEIDFTLRQFVPVAILLGGIYGFFMGWYAVITRDSAEYMQLLATTLKIPALFMLTLLVTFPSLYVFNALVGCQLNFRQTLRLLVGAIAVDLAVAASLGPILAFFTLSTKSYPFMVVLNVALLAIGGLVGLGFLLQTLRRLAVLGRAPHDAVDRDSAGKPGGSDIEAEEAPRKNEELPGPLDAAHEDYPGESYARGTSIFRVWVVIYALVGVQMGWLLRPFVGHPDLPFEWFRNRDGNFFLGLFRTLKTLLDADG